METIYGDLKGLKPSQLKQLQRLYHQRLPGDRVSTPEFAQRVGAVSTELGKLVCVYINRRGQVIRVGVGSPRETQIPPLELPRYGAERLSGIRCLATQLKSEGPKESSLTAMVLQRLDTLVTLKLTGQGFQRRGGGATGYVERAYLAHLLPNTQDEEWQSDRPYWTVSPPTSLDALCKQDFTDLVENLEAEFRREFTAQQVDPTHDRVLAVGLMTAGFDEMGFLNNLAELERLIDTAGGEILSTIIQKRSQPHPQTVVGAGKVQEIALAVQTLGASVVAFNRDLTPTQVRNLENQIGAHIIDRTEIILDIFAQRAQSRAGKLQVELAQLEYMRPRLSGRGQAMSRLGGGIGTRGPGETKLETERRAISSRISRLQQEVNQLRSHRNRMRQQRQRQGVPTVAIVGYTNAGKSTLINTLTNAEVYTADQLFATLDPTTRRLTVENAQGRNQTLLLTDTVGFIEELPPPLMDAFRATLEEVTEADALLHLVDLSHSAWRSHLASVNEILAEMPLVPPNVLLAFNKIDQVEPDALGQARLEYPQAVLISAWERAGLDQLRQRLSLLVDPVIAERVS
ncbi:MAG: GTPase HflX [Cyanobacteria bacterium P01_H01_bin.15]